MYRTGKVFFLLGVLIIFHLSILTALDRDVDLLSFSVSLTEELSVEIEWITGSETDLLGFNIQRGLNDNIAEALVLNPVIIPATNTASQQIYTHTDENVIPELTYYYWLEVQDLDLNSEFFGPVVITIAITEFAGGSGTTADPWQIETPQHLSNIRNYLGSEHSDKYFVQIADIDLGIPPWNSGEGWDPIGWFISEGNNNPFRGHYNGDGYIINGLFINRSENDMQGLFGYTYEATISNLGLTGLEVSGRSFVGGLVGLCGYSTINRSFTSGIINSDEMNSGGLVGFNWGDTSLISNCYSMVDITAWSTTGGLVGTNSGQILYSYSTGLVDGNEITGGLVGSGQSMSVINSYWNQETSGQMTSAGGRGCSTEEMIYPYAGNIYIGWNFTENWGADEEYQYNQGYPYLQIFHPYQEFAGGSGTEEDPWQIETAPQLSRVRNYTGYQHSDKYFIQISNINLGVPPWNSEEGWVPIGEMNNGGPYCGNYNGNGYVINELFINRGDEDVQGLFGVVAGAVIYDLSVHDVVITGYSNVGALAGLILDGAVIDNCLSSGSVTGNNDIGGLIGRMEALSSVWNSNSRCFVTGEGPSGGLVGTSQDSTIENSFSTGDVTGLINIGGLLGANISSSVANSYSSSLVLGDYLAGGLVGLNDNSTITSCYSLGGVAGINDLGGLVGGNSLAIITKSFSSGSVSGESNVGGFIGLHVELSVIHNCYSTGNVTGGSNTGGFAGHCASVAITNSYSKASVSGVTDVGGFVGFVASELGLIDTNNYWDTETSGQTDSQMGEGRTTLEMTYPYDMETFIDWDFGETWGADIEFEINEGYPYLRGVGYVSAEETDIVHPEQFKIVNYPNPFNPETTIRFDLRVRGEVELVVFNIKGQRVKTLLKEEREIGEQRIVWDGRDDRGNRVPSGVYFYSLQMEKKSFLRKMLLIK